MQHSEPNGPLPGEVAQPAASAANPNIYAPALAAQHQRSLGAAFAHLCLKVAVLSLSGNVVQMVVIGIMAWFLYHAPVNYFATENGRIKQVYAMDKPAWSESDVAQFGADTIREGFTLDFVHYKNQMTRVAPRFNEAGFAGYNQALTRSNVLALVRDKRMNLTPGVDPGVIASRGVINGRYAWEFQYPVTLRLEGQSTNSVPIRLIFTLRIQQADVRFKPSGLEVTQTITSHAG